MTNVVNNKAQNRYELTVDGHLAATYYKVSDGVITFIHTEVPPELGGKGVGSKTGEGRARPGAGRWLDGRSRNAPSSKPISKSIPNTLTS